METATITLATILTSVGDFFTASIDWMGDVFNTIGTQPIALLMVVCMPVAGFAIGGVKRLTRL